jgi:hypothetical protein
MKKTGALMRISLLLVLVVAVSCGRNNKTGGDSNKNTKISMAAIADGCDVAFTDEPDTQKRNEILLQLQRKKWVADRCEESSNMVRYQTVYTFGNPYKFDGISYFSLNSGSKYCDYDQYIYRPTRYIPGSMETINKLRISRAYDYRGIEVRLIQWIFDQETRRGKVVNQRCYTLAVGKDSPRSVLMGLFRESVGISQQPIEAQLLLDRDAQMTRFKSFSK